MSFFDRTLLKASEFALLRSEGKSVRYDSVAAAKAAWDQLPAGEQPHATIVADGTLYRLPEIVNL